MRMNYLASPSVFWPARFRALTMWLKVQLVCGFKRKWQIYNKVLMVQVQLLNASDLKNKSRLLRVTIYNLINAVMNFCLGLVWQGYFLFLSCTRLPSSCVESTLFDICSNDSKTLCLFIKLWILSNFRSVSFVK